MLATAPADATPETWQTANGLELWKTDGTTAGTERLYTGPARDLTQFNGALYFTGYDDQAGYELCARMERRRERSGWRT